MNHATREDLYSAIPHIMAAPKDGAAIEMLCLRPERNKRQFVDEIELTKLQGIPGERWASQPWLKLDDGRPHPGIQVCVLQKRVLNLIWRNRETVPHPGDTFVVDMDLSEANLPVGQLLQVGEAVLRVSNVFNDACVKWKARYGAEAKNWVTAPGHPKLRLRGILCSIEQDGRVRNDDLITKISSV